MKKFLSYRYGSDAPWVVGGIVASTIAIIATIAGGIITKDPGYFLGTTVLTIMALHMV